MAKKKKITVQTKTITSDDIFGFTPIDDSPRKLDRLRGESVDKAIERNVNNQIDNGLVKLTEERDGWKAVVSGLGDNDRSVIRATKKQAVLNLVFDRFYPGFSFNPAPPLKPNEINRPLVSSRKRMRITPKTPRLRK